MSAKSGRRTQSLNKARQSDKYRESDSAIVPMKRVMTVEGKGVNAQNNLTGKHFLYAEAGEKLK